MEMTMSKKNFNEQAEKLKSLVGSARLQTSSPALVSTAEATEQNGDMPSKLMLLRFELNPLRPRRKT
jgi:hypothetical protein